MKKHKASPATLLLFVKTHGASPIETCMCQAQQAAACDLVQTLLDSACVDRVIVATDDIAWAEALEGTGIMLDVDPPGEPFHLGRRLASLIERYQVDSALYAGGGSAPLMSAEMWREALAPVCEQNQMLATNNLHSSDWVAFRATQEAMPVIVSQDRDNGLAWLLSHEAGYRANSLPPTSATRFDLDTPADLLVARAHPGIGPVLTEYLAGLDWPTETVDRVLETLASEGSHLTIIGRSSSSALAALERSTQCWVRLFVEERGMVASGRLERGEVRSMLAEYVSRCGIDEFFDTLGTMADAVLMDSRVILASRGLWPSNSDRFNADLFRWQEVSEPFLRTFAQSASRAGIPVLMGGQAVVAGGLMALLDILVERQYDQ